MFIQTFVGFYFNFNGEKAENFRVVCVLANPKKMPNEKITTETKLHLSSSVVSGSDEKKLDNCLGDQSTANEKKMKNT